MLLAIWGGEKEPRSLRSEAILPESETLAGTHGFRGDFLYELRESRGAHICGEGHEVLIPC